MDGFHEEEEGKGVESLTKAEATAIQDAGQKYKENPLDVKLVCSIPDKSATLQGNSELSVQKRPRTSPLDVANNFSKKPAIICSFFAKGWCIKGNSCMFLHEKEASVCVGEQSKGDVGSPNRIGNLDDPRGKLGETEASNRYSLRQPLEASNAQSFEKSSLHLQRSLVHCYGRDTYASPKINDESNHELGISSEILYKGRYPGYDKRLKPFPMEENEGKSGIKPYPDISIDRLSDGQEFVSRHYPGEGRFYSEIPEGEFSNNSSVTRLSSWSSNPSIPGFKYKSQAFVETGISLSSSNNYPFRGEPDDLLLGYQKKSYNVDSSFNPLWDSKSDHVSTDLPSSAGWRSGLQENSWQLSAPFRSSFCAGPGSISSYSSYCDPLGDSVLPSKLGSTASASSGANIQNLPSKQGDPPFSGNFSLGFGAQRIPGILSQSYERILDRATSPREYGGHASVAAGQGSSTMDSRDDSDTSENKKQQVPELTHSVTINDINISRKLKNLEDKGKDNDEPKEVKMFRVALVEHLKELINPSWKDGLVSKDAHKFILKKATEKVIGSMQPHQFPCTGESIEQYLSVSHSKLKKLVEGYMSKHKSSSQG